MCNLLPWYARFIDGAAIVTSLFRVPERSTDKLSPPVAGGCSGAFTGLFFPECLKVVNRGRTERPRSGESERLHSDSRARRRRNGLQPQQGENHGLEPARLDSGGKLTLFSEGEEEEVH